MRPAIHGPGGAMKAACTIKGAMNCILPKKGAEKHPASRKSFSSHENTSECFKIDDFRLIA